MGSIRELTGKDGVNSYHAEVRLRGHPIQRATFRTKSLAKKWVQDTESAIRDGRHFRTSEAKRHTVAEMVDRFIAQWLTKYPDREKKQASLLGWWKENCGHLLLSDLTSAVIAECRDKLMEGQTVRGSIRSPSTVNRYLSALGKALSVAVKEWGWIEDSPMRKVAKPKEGTGRDRFLSLDEREKLLSECKTSSNPNLYPIVALALITGMRFGEITALTWRDVDFDRKTIVLQKTKNGDKRYLPLTDEAERIFMDMRDPEVHLDDLVFRSHRNRERSQSASIRSAFQTALKRSGIANFRFHDLRHTAASYLAMNGATQGELMAILGHRSPHMTRRYAHYSQSHLRNVLEKAARSSNQKH